MINLGSKDNFCHAHLSSLCVNLHIELVVGNKGSLIEQYQELPTEETTMNMCILRYCTSKKKKRSCPASS